MQRIAMCSKGLTVPRCVLRCFTAVLLQATSTVWAATPQISVGFGQGFAILDVNGVIWTTGGSSSQPAKFEGVSDAKSVSISQGTFWIIRADDSLWGMGSNNYGELGIGNPGSTVTSQPVKVLDGVKQVVESGSSTYAVRTDGSLWAWGRNFEAQLGLGDQANRSLPTKVPGLSNVVQVAAGPNSHAVMLTANGKVWAMGSNCCGQLGWTENLFLDDPRLYQSTAKAIPGIDNVVAIAAASQITYMVRADGTLWALGNNVEGQLGLGEIATHVGTPRQVLGLSGVMSVATGSQFSLALLKDGSVRGWGSNLSGQLGGLGRANEPAPIQLTFLSDVIAIGASEYSVAGFALRRDGSIVSWGGNANFSLGRGSIDMVMPPGPMVGPGGVGTFNVYATAPATINRPPVLRVDVTTSGSQAPVSANVTVSASDSDGRVTSVRIVSTDGQTAAISGASGSATFRFDRVGTYRVDTIAVDDQGGATVFRAPSITVKPPDVLITARAQIRAGDHGPIVLNSRGQVRNWGQIALIPRTGEDLWPKFAGYLSPAGLTYPYDPKISTVVSVEAANSGSFVVLQSGQVLAWGDDSQGAMGLATGIGKVDFPALVPALSNIVQVAGGWSHSIALDSQGRVYSTGANDYGQLGLGDRSARITFTPLQTLGNIVQIAAKQLTSYALDSSGTVWGWGKNNNGQVGNGSRVDVLSPQAIAGLPPIATLTADGVFAIARDGTVWAWGAGRFPDTNGAPGWPFLYPIQQPSLAGAIKISASNDVGAMLKADGSVWTWGVGGASILGDGTTADRTKPGIVPGLTNVIDISMSWQYALALRSDGTVLSWGVNKYGELGDGTYSKHLTPVLVVNETADGFLDLTPDTGFEVPPSVGVPFFVVASGGVSNSSASVSTTTKFNAPDVGKSGGVFVTAMVPDGTLGAAPSSSIVRSVSRATSRAATTPTPFVLIQLTASGWQQVVNGQLIPYATGVLGDQLSAQTILNNTDTTNLKGSEFCVGYGTSAEQMIAAGTMRTVVSIPDPNATSASTVTCIVAGAPLTFSLQVLSGWSLLGNSLNKILSVAALYGDANMVTTVWKWDAANAKWQFYAPSMDAAALQSYAAGKAYGVLSEIKPGEGYWVNAKSQPAPIAQSGNSFSPTAANLVTGWNLSGTGNNVTPSTFNTNLKSSLPGTGVTTLWAWDNPKANWYFYAPSLEAQGGTALSNYIASKGYLDFTSSGKTLGNGVGFWVNRPERH